MKVTIFQQDTLGLNDARFALFCYKLEKDTLVLLPEYTLNPFFLELKSMKIKQVIAQTNAQVRFLSALSMRYNIHFVAPIVRCVNRKFYKEIIYISPQNAKTFHNSLQEKLGIKTPTSINIAESNTLESNATINIDACLKIYPIYRQQRLIDYRHWNEAKFFRNHNTKMLKKPFIFEYKGFNIAVLFGFEVHFDEMWLSMKKSDADMVLLPCANTFDSIARWRELCKVRAFLNGCVVIRANRVGKAVVNENEWIFYGDSFIAMPNGEIIDNLRDKEAMLSLEIQKSKILEMAREWGFRKNF